MLNIFSTKLYQCRLACQNFTSRLSFVSMMKTKTDGRKINTNRVWFSNEAPFFLYGYVNKKKLSLFKIQMCLFLKVSVPKV